MPKTGTAKLLVEQAVSQLRAASAALAALRNEKQSLAASLPEYPVVMGMFGVGPALGPSSWRRLVMSVILQRSPADEQVYQFMDRKRAKGRASFPLPKIVLSL